MKQLLIITGGLALAALTMPWLVIIGFFLLIIPGLALALAPTLFGYLLATSAIRRFLPMPAGTRTTIVAGVAAVALGWLVAQPARLIAYAQYKLAQEQEVIPTSPIVPRGHVRLERPRMLGSNLRCDALCAGLLATPGVASVTIVEVGDDGVTPRETFRLAPKGSVRDAGFRPNEVSTFRSYPDRDGYKQREADDKALAAAWALRLATRETLVAELPRANPDMVIAMIDSRSDGSQVERVEVRRGETILFRRSLVTQRALTAPLYANLDGGMSNMHWGWGRSTWSTGPRYASFTHRDELLAHLKLAPPRVDQSSRDEMRARLITALDAPGAPADLGLAAAWLESFDYKTPEGADEEIVGRILADPRITDLEFFFKTHGKQPSVTLRRPIAKRILMYFTSQEERRRLGGLLKAMPEGTFAILTDDERTILALFRRDAAPFIERLADQGPSGLAPLLQILERAAVIEPWNEREGMVIAARRGLARLGPAARPALPRVLRLFEAETNPLGNAWQTSQEWRVAMVRMGLPPNQLPWPKSWKPDQILRERTEVLREVRAHDATWQSGYFY